LAQQAVQVPCLQAQAQEEEEQQQPRQLLGGALSEP
jgi:hypothetical protein